MIKNEYICIVCPNSCHITVEDRDGEIMVTGNDCKRGEIHGKKEYQNPERMLTTTVVVTGATHSRLPVISTVEIPKAKMEECLFVLYQTVVRAPVKCGQVIMKNICDTGADIVASRHMIQKEVNHAKR